MRIRLPFAGAFIALCLLFAYLGLSPHASPSSPSDPDDTGSPPPNNPNNLPTTPVLPINDKALHLITFFTLTSLFYFILDTSRRRTLHLTLVIVTLILGIGSEFLQALVPNGREFDIYDIAANVVGSLAALGLCTWYHMRMLERKRVKRGYGVVPGEDVDAGQDLELGEGIGGGVGAQSSGVVPAQSLETEVDNWDENLEDGWEEDGDEHEAEGGLKTPSASSAGEGEETKKRVD